MAHKVITGAAIRLKCLKSFIAGSIITAGLGGSALAYALYFGLLFAPGNVSVSDPKNIAMAQPGDFIGEIIEREAGNDY